MNTENLLRKLGLAAAFAMLLGAAACHTVEGIGQDVESAGDAIEDAAD